MVKGKPEPKLFIPLRDDNRVAVLLKFPVHRIAAHQAAIVGIKTAH
jgi:hypothetical protein